MTEKMRVHDFDADDIFTVQTMDWHGDTVLVTDTAGEPRTFDRDTVVEVLSAKLVCPACGSGDALVSHEKSTMGYHGVRFYRDPDEPNKPELDYESADTRYGDGEGFVDDIQCDNHVLLQLSLADLVPEGTPANPDWKPPTDRPAKIDAETALDQIAELFRDPDQAQAVYMVENIASIVRAAGRTVD